MPITCPRGGALEGGGELLHALRQAHGVTLGGVVHAQVVADLADDHVARVEADARLEVQAVLAAQLLAERAQGVAQVQRRVAGPLRVVLVRDGRPEERHDAVPRVLVDGPLEAMHTVGQDLEEAVEDRVPDLRIQSLGQLHRALHVGEEHRHLLALTLQGGLRLQDLVGQVLGRIVAGVVFRSTSCRLRGTGAALVAEPDASRELGTAPRTLDGHACTALEAETRADRVLMAAARADHAHTLRDPGS